MSQLTLVPVKGQVRRSRARALLRRGRWALLGLVIVAAAVLGFIGLGRVGPHSVGAARLPLPLADHLYYTVLLFKMTLPFTPPYPWELEVAQWLAPAAVLYTALSAAAAIFARQWAELRVRLWFRGHVVVCGLGDCGVRLATAFRARGLRVVVVEKDLTASAAPPGVEECRAQGIPIVAGDATDEHVLRRAGVANAGYLVAVCGEDETNSDVALAVRRALPGVPDAKRRASGEARFLRCSVQVGDDRLCRLLEEAVLADPSRANVRLEFFNVVRSGLKALLDEYGGILLEADPPPHLVVVGPGRVAHQLVAEASRRWWLLHGTSAERCHVTLVEPDAKRSVTLLEERFPALRTVCDLVACDADPAEPDSPSVAIGLAAPHPSCLAVICPEDDDAAAVRAAIVLRRSLPDAVPLVMCTRGRSAVPGLLGGGGSAGLPNVRTFGLLDRVCTPEVLLNGVPEELAQSVHADYLRRRREELAQMAHDGYVQRRQADGALALDDPALQPWGQLPETLRESNRDQAADIGRKLAMISCHLEPSPSWDAVPRPLSSEEVELLARAEHDRWCEERRRNGWQYGEVRDVQARRHPDLVPWEQLSERSKDLDRDAVRAVPLFLARLGYAIVPSEVAPTPSAAP